MTSKRAARARIDVHVHAMPDFYSEAAMEAGLRASISAGFPKWSPEMAFEFMERNNIDVSINSISPPGVHFGDDRSAAALARRCNEFLAENVARYPSRFGGLATLPLPDVRSAMLELEYALATLKMDGVCLFASYGNTFMGDAVFDPILERLNDASAVVFLHPNSHPSSLALGMKIPTFLVEYPFATTRAVANLIFSGALKRYPNIKFILAHNGGAVPFLLWRFAMAPLVDERFAEFTKDEILSSCANIYFESAQAAGPAPMASLASISDDTKWLFGSDWPYCPESVTQAGDQALVPQIADKFRDNALRLFPRFSAG